MRATVPLMILCACLSTLVACQREATAPEMSNTAPGADTAPVDVPPATAPVPPTTTGSVPEAMLTLVTAGVPQPFVADASSRTLYYVEGDTDGSKCTATCRETWPPVMVEAAAPAASSALTGTVATVARADGGQQVTYNGHPLYRYAGDAAVGRNAGHGVEDKWGHWFALAADGSALPKVAASTAPANKAAPAEQPKSDY